MTVDGKDLLLPLYGWVLAMVSTTMTQRRAESRARMVARRQQVEQATAEASRLGWEYHETMTPRATWMPSGSEEQAGVINAGLLLYRRFEAAGDVTAFSTRDTYLQDRMDTTYLRKAMNAASAAVKRAAEFDADEDRRDVYTALTLIWRHLSAFDQNRTSVRFLDDEPQRMKRKLKKLGRWWKSNTKRSE